MTKEKAIWRIGLVGVLTLALLLPALATPLRASAYDLPAYVRIGLKYGGTAVTSCTVTTTGTFNLGTADANGLYPASPLTGYDTLSAVVQNGTIALTDANGTTVVPDFGADNCLMANDPATGRITIDGAAYRGGVRFLLNSAGKITVVNILPLEQYLYGVLHREMGRSSPAEALKAQAVAARSYLAGNPTRHKADGFDYCATTHCQVYGGLKDEYPSTTQAVDATKGMILLSNGAPASANYHSNSGGHTLNSEDVWATAYPHLRGRPDPWSPVYSWSATFTFAQLSEKLVAAGFNIGAVQSVQITGRNSAGAVSRLTIIGQTGRADLQKDRVRTVFGATTVKSTMFNIGSVYTGGTPATPTPTPAPTGSAFLIGSDGQLVSIGTEVSVLTVDGTPTTKSTGILFLTNGNVTQAFPRLTLDPSPESGGDATIATGGSVTFSGRGYGHGVGMSQTGAIAMGKAGKTYLEILQFYYAGIEVR